MSAISAVWNAGMSGAEGFAVSAEWNAGTSGTEGFAASADMSVPTRSMIPTVSVPSAGSIDSYEYPSHDYIFTSGREPRECSKTLTVYLPYDYDETRRYNVIFLLAGTKSNENYYFSPQRYSPYGNVSFAAMFDYMIANKLCEPCIIVGFNFNNSKGSGTGSTSTDAQQAAMELPNDIIPFIVENFSTYARSGSKEDIIEARDHFALIGASAGAEMMYKMLTKSESTFKYCAWFGGLSGGAAPVGLIKAQLDGNDLPMRFLYICAGTNDFLRGMTRSEYKGIAERVDKCVDNENLVYQVIIGRHDARVWGAGLYNCLLTFFHGF